MKTLRARIVLPLASPPIEDGAVRIHEGHILEVGRWKDLGAPDAVDLGEVILMPGLINAHCHLDYTAMRGMIPPQANFPEWIARINELKRTFTEEDFLASIQQGFAELCKWGTTSVFNLESFPELLKRLPVPPVRTWWFYELLDIRGRISVEEVAAEAAGFLAAHPDWKGGYGLSPHAPYTASADLYRDTAAIAEKGVIPWTTHLSETKEEMLMFRDSAGPLYEFLKKFNRPMEDTGTCSPLAQVLKNQGAPRNGILTHMNILAEEDYDLLASQLPEATVVHCPKCHDYFGRAPFPLNRLRAQGIRVCLGTDSLASNDSLNLFAEMQEFQRIHPHIPEVEILDMVTRLPAKAIGEAGKLGEITPGAWADLIAIPSQIGLHEACEEVCGNLSPVPWIMVDGEVVPAGQTGAL